MWYGWLIVGMLIGGLLTYAAVTLPDWWARREFQAMPDVLIIEPETVPVESVTVGGQTFEVAKEHNGHLDRLATEIDRPTDG